MKVWLGAVAFIACTGLGAEECVVKGIDPAYNTKFEITAANECITLECKVLGAKNILQAVPLCLQVEKDKNLCSWERIPISKTEAKRLLNNAYSVRLSKCPQEQPTDV